MTAYFIFMGAGLLAFAVGYGIYFLYRKNQLWGLAATIIIGACIIPYTLDIINLAPNSDVTSTSTMIDTSQLQVASEIVYPLLFIAPIIMILMSFLLRDNEKTKTDE